MSFGVYGDFPLGLLGAFPETEMIELACVDSSFQRPLSPKELLNPLTVVVVVLCCGVFLVSGADYGAAYAGTTKNSNPLTVVVVVVSCGVLRVGSSGAKVTKGGGGKEVGAGRGTDKGACKLWLQHHSQTTP